MAEEKKITLKGGREAIVGLEVVGPRLKLAGAIRAVVPAKVDQDGKPLEAAKVHVAVAQVTVRGRLVEATCRMVEASPEELVALEDLGSELAKTAPASPPKGAKK